MDYCKISIYAFFVCFKIGTEIKVLKRQKETNDLLNFIYFFCIKIEKSKRSIWTMPNSGICFNRMLSCATNSIQKRSCHQICGRYEHVAHYLPTDRFIYAWNGWRSIQRCSGRWVTLHSVGHAINQTKNLPEPIFTSDLVCDECYKMAQTNSKTEMGLFWGKTISKNEGQSVL